MIVTELVEVAPRTGCCQPVVVNHVAPMAFIGLVGIPRVCGTGRNLHVDVGQFSGGPVLAGQVILQRNQVVPPRHQLGRRNEVCSIDVSGRHRQDHVRRYKDGKRCWSLTQRRVPLAVGVHAENEVRRFDHILNLDRDGANPGWATSEVDEQQSAECVCHLDDISVDRE